jgi:uridine kinase
MTHVIAISGNSNSGKTTLIKTLSQLENSCALYFDDYVEQTTYPSDMKKWLRNGADVNQINAWRFDEKVKEVAAEHKFDFIFIEEPFGRERRALSANIDSVICLDPPQDVCLARLIQRRLHEMHDTDLSGIKTYLFKYEDYFRDIYINVNKQVKLQADMVISGTFSTEGAFEKVKRYLKDTFIINPQ